MRKLIIISDSYCEPYIRECKEDKIETTLKDIFEKDEVFEEWNEGDHEIVIYDIGKKTI